MIFGVVASSRNPLDYGEKQQYAKCLLNYNNKSYMPAGQNEKTNQEEFMQLRNSYNKNRTLIVGNFSYFVID